MKLREINILFMGAATSNVLLLCLGIPIPPLYGILLLSAIIINGIFLQKEKQNKCIK